MDWYSGNQPLDALAARHFTSALAEFVLHELEARPPPFLMAGLNFNAITENATRLGARLQETFSEQTREFGIARGASASYFDTPEEKLKNIRKQLDSSSDREKLDAMKRLIAVRKDYLRELTTSETIGAESS